MAALPNRDDSKKIEFDQTVEDMADFHLFYAANNPTFKKQSFVFRLVKTIFAFLLPIGLFYIIVGRLITVGVVIGLLASILVFGSDPQSQKRAIVRRVKETFSNPKNKDMLGFQSIILAPEGISIKTQLSESKLAWKALDRVAQSERSVFLDIGSANAIVIPKRCFQSMNEQQNFIEYINSYIRHE